MPSYDKVPNRYFQFHRKFTSKHEGQKVDQVPETFISHYVTSPMLILYQLGCCV